MLKIFGIEEDKWEDYIEDNIESGEDLINHICNYTIVSPFTFDEPQSKQEIIQIFNMSSKWALNKLYDPLFLASLATLVDGSESTKMCFQIMLLADHVNANFKINSLMLWSGVSAYELNRHEAVEEWKKKNIEKFKE